MSLTTLYLPKMGESVIEAIVLHWCVQEGEPIVEGDILLEVATDKVDAEVPAMYSGTIRKLLVQKGEIVAIGAPIAILEAENGTIQPIETNVTEKIPSISTLTVVPTQDLSFTTTPLTVFGKHSLSMSPLVRGMVRKHHIHPEELENLVGNARDKRITKDLLLDYLKNKTRTLPAIESANLHVFQEPITPLEGDEVIQMDRVRTLIANRMVQSKKISPHVTSFMRADLTDLVDWRAQHKASFETKYGIKLTYNPLFMAAIVRALQVFPLLNAVVSNNQIIKRKHVNIGFAVALPDGNLLVPVVRKVETLPFTTLAKQIDTLIHKARSGTILADELTGASYTISNIGCFGNQMGTPIIVQPQVAILALGTIEKRPAVVHIGEEDVIAIRDEMFLSHTYDHRIIDGAVGGGFLKHLATELKLLPQHIDL
ncbi:dihydrolipoamide acetyltransferase family protein [Cardinium endosymbiont of Culicoides punctatus]|uniref:dihydrolipoamide acetyltransferase family protein n=1 Tax=Cardinium endosymbiont of Culicoides punctatus TaxID=2304601 RepID=UPI001058AF77|nr:dihydrolipoamide acetyltransferase family protein [Cardinium endosymbiont of Culicoides punctatus]TDG94963.1 Dihydrolipoyllysine-residue acetyltransferase component of pyruvate dehydrogenase complex [Cardinium endosymbiont of Culicoides punctatus]